MASWTSVYGLAFLAIVRISFWWFLSQRVILFIQRKWDFYEVVRAQIAKKVREGDSPGSVPSLSPVCPQPVPGLSPASPGSVSSLSRVCPQPVPGLSPACPRLVAGPPPVCPPPTHTPFLPSPMVEKSPRPHSTPPRRRTTPNMVPDPGCPKPGRQPGPGGRAHTPNPTPGHRTSDELRPIRQATKQEIPTSGR